MQLDSGLIVYCRNILHQHAAWVHGLPELGSHQIAPKIQQVAELLDSFCECYHRTYKSITNPGSQCEEDTILRELFPEPTVGTYVDIGAGEPQQCSNTWTFYQRGWRGLLIEPLPEFVFQLIRWRPGDMVFPVAASNRTGIVPFYVDSSVSSCHATWSKTSPAKPLAAECMAIAEILDFPDYQHIRDTCSLCSLDVEGHEWHVLSNIPWERFSPKVFCIEYRKYETDSMGIDLSPQWEPILLEHGYVLHATTILNKIYVKSEPTPEPTPEPEPEPTE